MTDLELFKAMLTRAGLPFTEEPFTRGTGHALTATAVTTITVAEDDGRVSGYSGFYTEFYFDAAGALVTLGAFE